MHVPSLTCPALASLKNQKMESCMNDLISADPGEALRLYGIRIHSSASRRPGQGLAKV
jgi:hypothetical protein